MLGREWAQALLDTQEYKDSLVRRIKNDSLDPRVEVHILALAYGKPVERIEAKVENVPEGSLDQQAPPEQVADEVLALAQLLQNIPPPAFDNDNAVN